MSLHKRCLEDVRIRRSRLRPSAEGLEDRLLMYATLGGNWLYGARITYSFAPDGTSVGGVPSAWYQRMNELGISEQVWQTEFRKAAAAWQAVTGINVVEVPDDGSAFSVSGNQQNDSRFGDIRIAGINQGSGILGAAFLPPPFNGGTLAGDILMNTAASWSINTTFDIRTVAVHEIGHALGMDHSTISSAVMYATYTGTKQSLNTDDINGIRSVYGIRPQDPFDAWINNQFYWNASNVTPYMNSSGQVRLANLDINTSSDADWYYVVAPSNTTGTMTATIQSTELSSLSPRVTVYNASLQGLGQVSDPFSYGSTVTFGVSGVTPGQGFFVRATAANTGPSGNGTYGLLINFGSSSIAPIPPPNTTVLEQPNQGGGSINLSNTPGNSVVAVARANGNSRLAQGDFEIITGSGKKKDHPQDMIRVGDLIGYGSALLVDASWDFETGQPVRSNRAPSKVRPGDAQATDVVVMNTEEVDLFGSLTAVRQRNRVATWAVDLALESWAGA